MIISCCILIIFTFILIGSIIYWSLKKDSKKSQNVAVFVGSFNPIHIGHKAIIDYLTQNFDWVYLFVTPREFNGDKIKEDYSTRLLEISNIMIKNEYFNVTVEGVDSKYKNNSFIIKVLRNLKDLYPNNTFKFVLGADKLQDIKEIESYQDILTEFGVLVFPRNKCNSKKLQEIKNILVYDNENYKIDIIKVKTPNVSSSDIKRSANMGENVDALLI